MNPTRFFLLAAALVLAAAFGLWFLTPSDSDSSDNDRNEVVAADTPLFSIPPDQVQSITILHPRLERRVRIEKSDSDQFPWEMTEPLLDHAEPYAAYEALRRVVGGDWKDAPAEWASRPLADLGLEKPRLVIVVDGADGATQRLKIGERAPAGDDHVAMIDDRILLVDISLLTFFERPPSDWRDHRLVIDGHRVQSIEWHPYSGEVLSLEKRDAEWHLESPVQAPLHERADNSLRAMLGARASVTSEDPIPDSLRAELLASERLVLKAPGFTQTLYMDGPYVMREDRVFLMHRSSETFTFLMTPVEDLRSQRIVTFRTDEIASLFLEGGGVTNHLRRKSGGANPVWSRTGGSDLGGTGAAIAEAVVKFVCEFEAEREIDKPDREPDGVLRVSRSHGDTLRGTQAMVWWAAEKQGTIVAAPGAAQAYAADVDMRLTLQNLVAGF